MDDATSKISMAIFENSCFSGLCFVNTMPLSLKSDLLQIGVNDFPEVCESRQWRATEAIPWGYLLRRN
jgi:hypothetical protein